MLGGVSGVVIVVLGAVLLWRSRRLDERPVRRYARRSVVAVLAAAATLFALVSRGIAIVATHRAREPVAAADLGRAYERVAFTTADGLRPRRLVRAVAQPRGRRALPGDAALWPTRGCSPPGYGVLLFDRRGEGQSDGDFNAYGWGGDADLKLIGFLTRRDDVDPERIGGLGLSVGGEMLLETAAEDGRLRLIVAEGATMRSWRNTGTIPPWVLHRSRSLRLPRRRSRSRCWRTRAAAEPPRPDRRHRPAVGHAHPRARGAAGGDPQPGLLRRGRRTQGALGGARRRTRPHSPCSPREYERRVIGFFDRALLARPTGRSRSSPGA